MAKPIDPTSPYAQGRLQCPACGGACDQNTRVCRFCGNHLAATRCPGCLALHFVGALLCTRCGEHLRPPSQGRPEGGPCPRCRGALLVLEHHPGICECGACGGLFVEHRTLKRVVESKDETAALRSERPEPAFIAEQPIAYLMCPLCAKHMNRANYGRYSGVIVDVCHQHGTWFDAGELTRVIEFVQSGGLGEMRARERAELEEERRKLASERAKTNQALGSIGRDPLGSGLGGPILGYSWLARILAALVIDD